MSHTNRLTVPSADAITEWLDDTQAAQIARRDEILAGYRRFTERYPDGIPSEDVQARAADFASAKGIMGVFLKEVKTDHDREKAPYTAGGKAVDTFFNALSGPVTKCQTDMRAHMARYAAKVEAERREAARLEAARAAAEAAELAAQAAETQDDGDAQNAEDAADAAAQAQAHAEASVAELSRTRGDLGTVVSLRVRHVADLEASNLMALVKAVAEGRAPLAYLQFNATRINYAVRSEKVRDIPGVVIKEERTVV